MTAKQRRRRKERGTKSISQADVDFALAMRDLWEAPEGNPFASCSYKDGFFPTLDDNGKVDWYGWLAHNPTSFLAGEQEALKLLAEGHTHWAAHDLWGYDLRLNAHDQQINELGDASKPAVNHNFSRECSILAMLRRPELTWCRKGGRDFFDVRRANGPRRGWCWHCSCAKCEDAKASRQELDPLAE